MPLKIHSKSQNKKAPIERVLQSLPTNNQTIDLKI
jgi:hypothetical protein